MQKLYLKEGVYYEKQKIFTVTAVTVLLSMTLLTGCGDNSREKALEDQVSQLEQEGNRSPDYSAEKKYGK